MSEPSEDLDAVWRSILAAVSHDGVPAPHRAFLSLARFVGLLDGTALVAVPNNYCKTYVERALRVPVTQAFSAHYGQDVRLAVTVDPDLDDTEDELPQPDEGLVRQLAELVKAPSDGLVERVSGMLTRLRDADPARGSSVPWTADDLLTAYAATDATGASPVPPASSSSGQGIRRPGAAGCLARSRQGADGTGKGARGVRGADPARFPQAARRLQGKPRELHRRQRQDARL